LCQVPLPLVSAAFVPQVHGVFQHLIQRIKHGWFRPGS
jgi:hypothetical protein